MSNFDFYPKKANELLNELNAIDAKKLENERSSQSLNFIMNRGEEKQYENLNILYDLKLQIQQLFLLHPNSIVFLDRLKDSENFIFDTANKSEKLKMSLLKVLNEFITYCNLKDESK